MTQVKRIVCLANSRKLHGRCVAGIEVVDGVAVEWIRPVSARVHQEVSEGERQYPDGSDPRVLDIIDVPLVEARPQSYQRENWLLDSETYWEKAGTVPYAGLAELASPAASLWINGYHTYYGLNDQIPLDEAQTLESSLRLLFVEDLSLQVFAPGAAFGNRKRRVQGRFSLAGVSYRLWVTDPGYEKTYLALPNGVHEIGECYLTVSLGEAHDGYCYKLIATIVRETGGASE